MELCNLETFIDIADTKSFSQSAKNLNLSQPAVSKRIAALESVLMTKLFHRAGGHVKLTEFGEMLLPSARLIQAEVIRIGDAIGAPREQVGGRLRLGATNYIARYKLPNILKQFRDSYPEASIDLRFGTTEEVVAGMEQERFELGLISMFPDDVPDLPGKLDCTEIWSEKIVTVVSTDHPLNHVPLLSIQDLNGVPALMPGSDSALSKSIVKKLVKHEVEHVAFIESNDFELIRIFASSGLGWACVPKSRVDSSLVELPIAELRNRKADSLVRRCDRTLSRAAGAFLDLLPSS